MLPGSAFLTQPETEIEKETDMKSHKNHNSQNNYKAAPLNGFGNALEGLDLRKVVQQVPRLKLMTSACVAKATRDYAPVAEALVGYDVNSKKIVRFTDVIVPGMNEKPGHTWALHKDKGYPLFARPIEGAHWFHMAYCDIWKLGQDPQVVFAILRVFRHDARPKGGRIQLALMLPKDNGEFYRTAENTRAVFNADEAQGLFSVAPLRTKAGSFSHAWTNQILSALSAFSGVALVNSYQSAEEQLEEFKANGNIPEDTVIEDFSEEEPTNHQAQVLTIADTMEDSEDQVPEEEEPTGHEDEITDALIPTNPMLVTAGGEDEEDEVIPM